MWLGNRIGARHFGRVAPHVWQAMVALVLGIAAVALAPVLTVRRVRRMDIPSTLRVVE
jgi:hypothetical protein